MLENKLIKMLYSNICFYNCSNNFYIHYTVYLSFAFQDLFYIFANLSSSLSHQFLPYNNKTMLLSQ